MSYMGRGSYFAAAVAGVASAFYIFEPEFKELKRQREASGQASAVAAVSDGAASSSPPSAAAGRWQEMTSKEGRVYWMNLDTGDRAEHNCAPPLMRARCSSSRIVCAH
jgi:hypothetical protein